MIKKRILILDDDDSVRAALHDLFDIAGYEVMIAKNGQEAFRLMATFIPDLILFDVNMPVMNGYEFRAAQLNHPVFSKIPSILLSAVHPADQFQNVQATIKLTKPVDTHVLLSNVRYLTEVNHR